MTRRVPERNRSPPLLLSSPQPNLPCESGYTAPDANAESAEKPTAPSCTSVRAESFTLVFNGPNGRYSCDTCKRRKERCDGIQPCKRCILRGVHQGCTYSIRVQRSPTSYNPAPKRSQSSSSTYSRAYEFHTYTAYPSEGQCSLDQAVDGLPSVPRGDYTSEQPYPKPTFPEVQVLVPSCNGTLFCLGASSNVSVLQRIRDLVAASLGPCSLIDEPLHQYLSVEPSRGPTDGSTFSGAPSKPDFSEASYLIDWAIRATDGALGIYKGTAVSEHVSNWLKLRDHDDEPLAQAVYFLIFANGAFLCPEDRDDLADAYFQHGQFLSMLGCTGEPSITSILYRIWLGLYLVSARGPYEAVTSLNDAVREAHSLGIHVVDAPGNARDEHALRERIWKTLRMMDVFLSISLGQPMITTETRNTKASLEYSAINDLAAIMETTITTIYNKPGKISRLFLCDLINQHRVWVDRFTSELEAVPRDESLDFKTRDKLRLIDSLRLSYYWSIMLLTRPLLFEKVSVQMSQHATGGRSGSAFGADFADPDFSEVLVSACVHSAVRCIDASQDALSHSRQVKRLPYVVNAVFNAALTVGVAAFTDLDQTFPLMDSLRKAQLLLEKLQPYDRLARTYLTTIKHLRVSRDIYVTRHTYAKMARQEKTIEKMFGRLQDFSSSKRQEDVLTRCHGDSAPSTSDMSCNARSEATSSPFDGIFDVDPSIFDPRPGPENFAAPVSHGLEFDLLDII